MQDNDFLLTRAFLWSVIARFTALLLFDYTFVVLYNLLFTSLPVMFMGAFDQDVDAKTSMQFPALYLRGIKQKHFTRGKFWLYVLDAVYQSIICFFIPWYLSNDLYASGHSTNDLVALGTLISACSVVVANLYVGLNMFHWTKMIFTVIFGSIIVFFLYCWVYANFFTIENTFYGMDSIILNSPAFWLAILLSVILTMLPHYVYKFARQYLKPNDIIIVREQLYREKHPSKKERRARKLKAMALREAELNGTTSSFQDPGLTSSNNHVLGDDDIDDDNDLDQVPIIRNSPTILSPEDPNKQVPGDIRQRQPSPSPMASLSRMDETYHLKASSEASTGSSGSHHSQQPPHQQPPRELVGRRRVHSSNNKTGSTSALPTFETSGEQDDTGRTQMATPFRTFDNNASSSSLPGSGARLEAPRKFAQGYPTTSFSFNQEFVASAAAGGAAGGQSPHRVSTPGDRPRAKRQSTPSIPVGGPNFRFMGGDSPPVPGSSSTGNTAGVSGVAGYGGFAFSADEASAFVYSHLNRVHSASHDERTPSAKSKRASMYQGRNSIDGSEFGSGTLPVGTDSDPLSGVHRVWSPDSTASVSPRGDTTAVETFASSPSRPGSIQRRPRGLSRSITAPDIPVAELGALLLQQQKEMEQGMERLSKAQASIRAATQQRQSLQKVRFQGPAEDTESSSPELEGAAPSSTIPGHGSSASSSSTSNHRDTHPKGE